jgi:RNA polymerase-binding protein DksA
MATSRKTSATRTKSVRPGSKPSRSARAGVSAAGKAATKGARSATKEARSATKEARSKSAAKRTPPRPPAAPARKPVAVPKSVKPAPALKPQGKSANLKPNAKAVVKGKSARPAVAGSKRPPAEVRPLGVLPPESMMRSSRPAAPAVARPRPTSTGPRPTQATGQGAKRVTEQELKEFESRLLEERRKILKEMGHLETTVLKVNQRDSSGDLSGYSFHMADAGTDAMEREKAFMFASTEGRQLMEINEALRRLYRGDYGVCESCGQPIAHGRLQAMPHARLCVSCKEKEERAQRGAQ